MSPKAPRQYFKDVNSRGVRLEPPLKTDVDREKLNNKYEVIGARVVKPHHDSALILKSVKRVKANTRGEEPIPPKKQEAKSGDNHFSPEKQE